MTPRRSSPPVRWLLLPALVLLVVLAVGGNAAVPGASIPASNAPGAQVLTMAEAAKLIARQPSTPQQVRLAGTVSHQFRNVSMVLQEGDHVALAVLHGSLQKTEQEVLRPGDRVAVTGFLSRHYNGFPVVTEARYEVIDRTNPPPPQRVTADELMAGRHAHRIVTIRARVIDVTPFRRGNFLSVGLWLQAGETTFEANLREAGPAGLKATAGQYADVTGLAVLETGQQTPVRRFQMHLRDAGDFVPAAAPRFWTQRWFHLLLAGAGVATLLGGAWVLLLRRQMQRLQRSHAQLEERIAARASELLAANARLTGEVAERNRAEKVQKALYAISEAIHNVEDLPSLYARIHEIIGTLMPAGNFYIALHDAATDMVSFPYHRDAMDPPPKARKARRGMTEYVLRTGRAALADLNEIERLKTAGEYIQSGAPAKIWLGVPLTAGGRTFGVMALQDHHDAKAYGEDEKRILSFVAGQTALAIERKRAESDLRVALAAEKELGELKSSFVSMVSHEFRTPLEVVLSSSNILDRYFDRLPVDKRKAQLRAIRKSVRRMNDLVEDVLMLGKFDAGRMTLTPTPLDLTALCRRVIEDVATAMDGDGRIRLEVSPEVNGDAVADESLLSHILTNLLGNALKYSPGESDIEFAVHRRGIEVEFIVRDQGCGIPAADLPHLFTAFRRGTNVGQKSGSGLGLVIVKRCVDLHGGTVRCESVENRGATFTVTLPVFEGTAFFRKPAAAPTETKS